MSCYSQIKNNSSCPWTVSAQSSHGNVWFGGVSCVAETKKAQTLCNPENGPCLLEPTCSVNIQYTYTSGESNGNLTVVDQNGGTDSWRYHNILLGSCPYIEHSGSTGPVYLNDPDNGDITFGGCSFNGSAAKEKSRRR
jgi:hypothetical protein